VHPVAKLASSRRLHAATNSPKLPLSRRLRAETKVAHKLVEATRFARAFFKGTLTTAVYAEALARIHPVYEAMERGLRRGAADPVLGRFHLPAVFRAEALARDMQHFGVAPTARRSPASDAYRDHVVAIADGAKPSWLLVAHAYVRYLGDVSGGVIAGKLAQRALQLPSREGLSFFDFGDLDPAAFRADFRARLDAVTLGEPRLALLVAEANLAFELNRALADEIWDELLR
jgi:heme oxygenase